MPANGAYSPEYGHAQWVCKRALMHPRVRCCRLKAHCVASPPFGFVFALLSPAHRRRSSLHQLPDPICVCHVDTVSQSEPRHFQCATSLAQIRIDASLPIDAPPSRASRHSKNWFCFENWHLFTAFSAGLTFVGQCFTVNISTLLVFPSPTFCSPKCQFACQQIDSLLMLWILTSGHDEWSPITKKNSWILLMTQRLRKKKSLVIDHFKLTGNSI